MSDYPLTLAGAHGRIDAYRYALKRAHEALNVARFTVHPEAQAQIDAVTRLIEAEFAVTNP